MILRVFLLNICASLGVFAQTISPIVIPNAIADGGGSGSVGTPYAVFVRIQGWTAAAGSQVYLKLYSSTNNEYLWSATSVWSNTTTYAASNQPVATLDASGNWSGWVYAKHNSLLGTTAAVRAARVGATSTNLTSSTKTFAILNMSTSGNGGWIYRNSSPALNKAIAAYSGGAVVGTYRTEENGIAEGYAYAGGGFKIAVPAGSVDSLVTFNDDGTRDQLFPGPWIVRAGESTDASVVISQFGPGTASITPTTIPGGISQQLAIRIQGSAGDTIRSAAIRIPNGWLWNGLADLTLTAPGSPVVTVRADTIAVTGIFAAGTSEINFNLTITPPDTTASVTISVLTSTAPDSLFPIRNYPSVFLHGIPVAIATAKENDANGVPLRLNRWVTVQGIVTVANEFGGPSYVQDNSGGIAVYGSTFSGAVSTGDEVVVSGLLQPFNGLCEIVTPVLAMIVTRGNTILPQVVTAAQIAGDGAGGIEQYEGLLVRLNGVTVGASGAWGSGVNYPLTDASGSTEIRIDNNTDLVGAVIPGSSFDCIGVIGQYITTSPYIGGYQFMPRTRADVISTGPIIASEPRETAITPTGFVVVWNTLHPGSSQLRFGLTPTLELGVAGDTLQKTSHAVLLSGLTPGSVYYCRAFSVAGPDTSTAPLLIASTASPAGTTGAINVYFNTGIDTSVAWSIPANGRQDLVARLVHRLNGARRSIDASLYNLSGTPGPGTDVANALVAAKNRGVSVRVVCEADNRNTSPFNTLVSNGIPLITDTFDPVNAGAGLMHNKFFVIDGRGGDPESVWVWTGSWNPTDPGTNQDYQNAVEIQDQALAGAYTLEFNEMWGSAGPIPNSSLSRFGARKTDNTPHRFVIGGKEVECYFSPSDRTTSRIKARIDSAAHSVAFALLTFTRTDLRSSLVAKKGVGVKVRGVLDNNTDTGTQYPSLIAAGVDVRLKTGSGYLLHHKYCVIDAESPSWAPVAITGSHNWSNSAETSNGENTLIIHDHAIANAFLQEFTARYYQYGGSDTIRVAVGEEPGIPRVLELHQNYPNPFNPETTVEFSLPTAQRITLQVFDLLGRHVRTLVDESLSAGRHAARFDGSRLASGAYLLRLEAGSTAVVRRILLLK